MKCEKCGKDIPEQIDYCPTCKINEMKGINVNVVQTNQESHNSENIATVIDSTPSQVGVPISSNANSPEFINSVSGMRPPQINIVPAQEKTHFTVSAFTRKFIINVMFYGIVGLIIQGIILYVVEGLSNNPYISPAITVLVLWQVYSLSIKQIFKKHTVATKDIKTITNRIYLILAIIPTALLLSASYITFSSDIPLNELAGSPLGNLILMSYITSIISSIISYIVPVIICKKIMIKETQKQENISTNQDDNINSNNSNGKFILFIIIMILIIVAFFIGPKLIYNTVIKPNMNKNQQNLNNDSRSTTTTTTTAPSNNKNPLIDSKYPNADWIEVTPSYSANVNSDIAWVSVSLTNFEKDKIIKYKAVKFLCTIYKESNNSIIGESETYYENIELNYGYFNFSPAISVKLSTSFVGNDFSVKVKAYAIEG